MDKVNISEFYDVEKHCSLFSNSMGAVRDYLAGVLYQLESLVEKGSPGEDQNSRYDKVFGHIFAAALDHEKLADYFLQNNMDDIHEGGLCTNVIRLLEELKMRRENTPFSG